MMPPKEEGATRAARVSLAWGIFARVIMYWLWVPSIVIAAILLTPGVNMIAKDEADYGRKCARNPEQQHC